MNEYNIKQRKQREKRSAKVKAMRESGMTFAQIANKLGVSRQRAQQLCK